MFHDHEIDEVTSDLATTIQATKESLGGTKTTAEALLSSDARTNVALVLTIFSVAIEQITQKKLQLISGVKICNSLVFRSYC